MYPPSVLSAIEFLEAYQEDVSRRTGIKIKGANNISGEDDKEFDLPEGAKERILRELSNIGEATPGSKYDPADLRGVLALAFNDFSKMVAPKTIPTPIFGFIPSVSFSPLARRATRAKGQTLVLMSVGAWDFLFNTAAGLLRIVPYTHTLGDLPKDKIEIEHLFEPHVSEALPIMLHQLLTSVTGKAQLATDIVQQATGLASSYLKLPKSSQLYLSDGKVSLITDLANCMFHFIIAHEFAHYLYEESSFVPQGGFGPIALQEAMKKFLHRSSIELEADNIASKLLIFRMHNLSIPVETAVASIGTFFLLTDLVYDCVHVLQTGYSAEGSVVHATHPPALGRAKHIMRVLPTDPQFPRLIKDFNQRFEKADLILQQLENVFSRVITPRILNWFSENRGKRSGGGTLRRIGSL